MSNVRGSFENELNEVRNEIIQMGNDVHDAFLSSLEGLRSGDAQKQAAVIEEDKNINALELKINEKVTFMIAKEQPVASDLRKLIVALKISSDLERVGDLAVDIAKSSQRLVTNELEDRKKQLLKIAKIAQMMLADALQAYFQQDVVQAQKIAVMDDSVDQMYGEFIRELFHFESSKEKLSQVTNLAFIGRYIERIADYATNLAEWVVYEVNGQYFDLN